MTEGAEPRGEREFEALGRGAGRVLRGLGPQGEETMLTPPVITNQIIHTCSPTLLTLLIHTLFC
jgi:hypothetical protein